MEGRAIDRTAVETALRGPLHLVENYPDDPRGSSCLLLGYADEQPLHLCVTHPPQVFLITVYDPRSEPETWSEDFRRRVR